MVWRRALRVVADPTGTAQDYFGEEVAITDSPDGLYAFVGHAQEDPSGSIYVYRRIGQDASSLGEWERVTTLRGFDYLFESSVGQDLEVALTPEGILLVGTASATSTILGGDSSGEAYVYFKPNGTDEWTHVARLQPSDHANTGYFGKGLAVSPRGIVAVGRPGRVQESHNGAVFLYDLSGLLPVAAEGVPALSEDDGLRVVSVAPNPSSREVVVRYQTRTDGPSEITFVDALGREVARQSASARPAGVHEARFDVSALPTGVYAVRVEFGGASAVRPLAVAR